MSSIVLDMTKFGRGNLKNWIFKDFANPVEVKVNRRDIKESLDYSAIENSLANIFLFVPGENIVFPNFGNSLYKYVYEPITTDTIERVREELTTIFRVWEPRVMIVSLDIVPIYDENTIYIQLKYTVPVFNDGKILDFNVGIRRGER